MTKRMILVAVASFCFVPLAAAADDQPVSLKEQFRKAQLYNMSDIGGGSDDIWALTRIRGNRFQLTDEQRKIAVDYLEKRIREAPAKFRELEEGRVLPTLNYRALPMTFKGLGRFPKELAFEVIEIQGPRLMLALATEEEREIIKVNLNGVPGKSLGRRKQLFLCRFRNLPTAKLSKGDRIDVSKTSFQLIDVERNGRYRIRVFQPVNLKQFLAPPKTVDKEKKLPPFTAREVTEWALSTRSLKNVFFVDVRTSKGVERIKSPIDIPFGEFQVVGLNIGSKSRVYNSHIERLKGLTDLKLLFIAGTVITDEALKTVSGFENLEQLDVGPLPITDEGLRQISGLKHLRVLDLSRTFVTDEGLKHVAKMSSLETLTLEEVLITDRGLEHLKELKNLKRLNVEGAFVTIDGLRDLKQALPELKIQYK